MEHDIDNNYEILQILQLQEHMNILFQTFETGVSQTINNKTS